MGVVVRGYIDILIIIITFPYPTCIFWGQQHPYFVRLKKKLFLFVIFLQYSKRCSKNNRDCKKI